MTNLQTAALYAALNLLILLGGAIYVINRRLKTKTAFGDGGHSELAQAIRAHANAAENAPGLLVGLLILSLAPEAASVPYLHAAGATLTLGRAAHVVGLSRNSGPSVGRGLGMLLTFVSYGLIIGGLLWASIGLGVLGAA